jgi:hypothetical protein
VRIRTVPRVEIQSRLQQVEERIRSRAETEERVRDVREQLERRRVTRRVINW